MEFHAVNIEFRLNTKELAYTNDYSSFVSKLFSENSLNNLEGNHVFLFTKFGHLLLLWNTAKIS